MPTDLMRDAFWLNPIGGLGSPLPFLWERSDRIARCDPGEGLLYRETVPPHPNPLPTGEGAPFRRGHISPSLHHALAAAIFLLTSLAVTAARAEGDAAKGEARFQECAACHRLEAGVNEVGPSLHGIFSRKSGELSDFRYSPAMKRAGITWTAETLDKYVADPQAFIPANRMPYAGMSSANDRADLIAYLQKATK